MPTCGGKGIFMPPIGPVGIPCEPAVDGGGRPPLATNAPIIIIISQLVGTHI